MSERDDPKKVWIRTPTGLFVPAPLRARAPTAGPRPQALRPSFEYIKPFLCGSELTGAPARKAAIIEYLRPFGRVPTFWKLAVVAATIANRGVTSRLARQLTTDALIAHTSNVNPWAHSIADFASTHRERVIAHERVVYWLQCLALAVCGESDAEPSWADLAWLMLRANDHLDGVAEPSDGATISWLERTLATFAVVSRFNTGGDPLAAHVRGYEMTSIRPQDGRLATAEAWEKLQREAFHGATFHDYFVEILSPLYLVSSMWGARSDPAHPIDPPVIHPERWYAETRSKPEAAAEVFERLSVSIEEARRELLGDLDTDGVPRSPTTFAHRPFLKIADGTLIAASPWLLREQLRLGLWDRCRRASHALHGTSVWNPAFGQSFELWARQAASRAEGSGHLKGRVVMSARVGDTDELEDVVIVGDGVVMLGSAKSRLMPGDLLHHATDPRKVVDWYESVLFALAKDEHRAGALRLLDRRVQRIRSGDADGVASDARIYPVLITYERLGDSPVLHTWVHERCVALGVLRQANVAPVTFVSASEYEWLMAAAARGISIFDILECRASTDDGLVTFDSALRQFVDEREPLRLPGVEDRYFELMNETTMRLFGKPYARPQPGEISEADDDD